MKFHSTLLFGRATLVTAALAATLTLGHAAGISKDLDGDGIPNRTDTDLDGDGIPNGADRNVDGGTCRKGPFKGKYVGDRLKNDDPSEKDIDDDGLSDDSAAELDIDGDGMKDDSIKEQDIDGDGRANKSDDDIDGDGRRNGTDDDCDGDGKGRGRDRDDDGDGVDDNSDSDDDNDGLSDDDESEVEVALSPTPAAPAESRVRAKVKLYPGGKIELEFDARSLAAGSYDVIVAGTNLGSLSLVADKKGRTEGEVRFETNPDKADELPLPFNPFNQPVLISAAGTTYFSGTIPAPSDVFTGSGDDNGSGQILTSSLVKSSGLSSEAEGSVEIQVGSKGVVGLEIEVEGIPAGNYDVAVDGTVRASISVVLVKGKPKGKLRFEVVPDGNGELPLDFAVAGKSIVVSQGSTTFFSGTAPSI